MTAPSDSAPLRLLRALVARRPWWLPLDNPTPPSHDLDLDALRDENATFWVCNNGECFAQAIVPDAAIVGLIEAAERAMTHPGEGGST